MASSTSTKLGGGGGNDEAASPPSLALEPKIQHGCHITPAMAPIPPAVGVGMRLAGTDIRMAQREPGKETSCACCKNPCQ